MTPSASRVRRVWEGSRGITNFSKKRAGFFVKAA
jgi:hypothetical protein